MRCAKPVKDNAATEWIIEKASKNGKFVKMVVTIKFENYLVRTILRSKNLKLDKEVLKLLLKLKTGLNWIF